MPAPSLHVLPSYSALSSLDTGPISGNKLMAAPPQSDSHAMLGQSTSSWPHMEHQKTL